MKKYIFLSLILITSIATSNAKQRTRYEILKSAQAVLSQHTGNRAMSQAESPLDIIKSNSQLTIVGDKNGFAVVANDDSFPAILGYSDKQFDGGQVAPGFQWWMDAITEQLEYNLEHGLQLTTATPSAGKHKDNVPALMVTQWGQNTPYNNQTPTYTSGKNEVHYVTGCVATAMAQIMYYHKWPERGKGQVSYYFTPEGSTAKQKLTANLAKAPYDWDNMLTSYSKGYTEEQANAVSTLMLHCGYSVNMQYTKSGSGAFTSDAADAMRKRFYYNENMHFYRRDFFPDEDWMDKIFTELTEGFPVLYGAQSSTGGHEFVFDGYNAEGQVHVNWGWNGGQNGFFDIAALNGYTSGQEMVLVRKDSEIIPYQSYWGMSEDGLTASVLGSTVKASFVAYNLDYNTFTGKVGFLAMNLSNMSITVLDSNDKTAIEYLSGAHFDYNSNISSLTDGKYRLYAGSQSEKETEWQPIRCYETSNNSYILTINDGVASIEKENNANWTGIEGLIVDSDNKARYFDLQGREVSPETKGLLIRKQGNEVKKVIVR